MKKIKLEIDTTNFVVSKVDKKYKYNVYFGGNRLYFESKRKAQDFLVKLSRCVNDILLQCMEVQKQLYGLYLDYYLYLTPRQTIALQRHIDKFTEKLPYVYKSYSSGNSAFSMNALFYIMRSLEGFISSFSRISKERNDYRLVNRLASMSLTSQLLESNLESLISTHDIESRYRSKLMVKHNSKHDLKALSV